MWCATTRGVLCCSHMFLRNTRAVLGALLQYSHQTSAEAAIEELKVVQRCSSFGAAPDRYTRNRISHPQGVQSWMEVPEIPGSRSAFWRELVLSRITKISTNQTITDYPLHPLSILLWEVGSGVTFIDVLVYSPRVIEFIPHSTRNTQDFCGETRRFFFRTLSKFNKDYQLDEVIIPTKFDHCHISFESHTPMLWRWIHSWH